MPTYSYPKTALTGSYIEQRLGLAPGQVLAVRQNRDDGTTIETSVTLTSQQQKKMEFLAANLFPTPVLYPDGTLQETTGSGDMLKATYDPNADGIIEPAQLNLSGKANVSHNHIEGDVTGLVTDLAAKEATANKGAVGGYAPLDASQKVPATNLGGSGADNTKYLRGDQTWVTPSALPPSGSVVLLNADEAETAGGSTEQVKTYSLPVNSYSRIIVEGEYEIAGAANTKFEWTVAAEIPQASVIHDSNIRGDATGSGDIFKYTGSYKGSAVQTAAAILRIRITPVTAGSATAKILSMRVYGVVA